MQSARGPRELTPPGCPLCIVPWEHLVRTHLSIICSVKATCMLNTCIPCLALTSALAILRMHPLCREPQDHPSPCLHFSFSYTARIPSVQRDPGPTYYLVPTSLSAVLPGYLLCGEPRDLPSLCPLQLSHQGTLCADGPKATPTYAQFSSGIPPGQTQHGVP